MDKKYVDEEYNNIILQCKKRGLELSRSMTKDRFSKVNQCTSIGMLTSCDDKQVIAKYNIPPELRRRDIYIHPYRLGRQIGDEIIFMPSTTYGVLDLESFFVRGYVTGPSVIIDGEPEGNHREFTYTILSEKHDA